MRSACDACQRSGHTSQQTLQIRVAAFCSALQATTDHNVDLNDLVVAVTKPPTGPHRHNGKDVVALAGVALRRKAGSLQLAPTRVDVLCGTLRSGAALRLSRSPWLGDLRELLAI